MQDHIEGASTITPQKKRKTNPWKIVAIVLMVVVVLLLIGGAVYGYSLARGTGNTIRESREITQSFSEVTLSGGFHLYLVQGEEVSLEIEADERILENIKTQINDDELKIQDRNWYFLSSLIGLTDDTNVYLTVPDLDKIQVSGSADIDSEVFQTEELTIGISGSGNIDMGLDVQKFSLDISGSGKAELRGLAQSLSVDISGSGEVLARDLESSLVNITVSGSGEIETFVRDSLNVEISGSGNVDYFGSPATVNQNINGSGNVTKRGD